MSYNEIVTWSDRGQIDALYPQDDWNPLLYTASVGEVEAAKYLLSEGAEVNFQTQGKVLPQLTALHVAVRAGNMEMVKLLAHHGDCNRQDQWGFTPIHYATIARNKEIVAYLLSNGASATVESKAKTTALDMAKELKFNDIMDLLASKSTLEMDPTLPQFRAWLCHLGAGEYLAKFIDSGYDLRFISKGGLTHEDLDAVGIPSMEKRCGLFLFPFCSFSMCFLLSFACTSRAPLSFGPLPRQVSPSRSVILTSRLPPPSYAGVSVASSLISGSWTSFTRPMRTTMRMPTRRGRRKMRRMNRGRDENVLKYNEGCRYCGGASMCNSWNWCNYELVNGPVVVTRNP